MKSSNIESKKGIFRLKIFKTKGKYGVGNKAGYKNKYLTLPKILTQKNSEEKEKNLKEIGSLLNFI